jgi:hypothetical protein
MSRDHIETTPVIPRKSEERRVSMSTHRASIFSPEIELLKRRREVLIHMSSEAAEAEQLRKDIETLERELRYASRYHEQTTKAQQKVKLKGGVKLFTRPKVRAYFNREKLFKSRGDNEYAATSSLSLFTDLLFVGVLATTGQLAVIDSDPINLARFIVQFLPSWRIWCFVRDIVSIYEMNAASQRFIILWILFLLVGFTVKYAFLCCADN